MEAELSATGRPFVLGRGQADSCSPDRQGRGLRGRPCRGPARGHLTFSCLPAPRRTRRTPQDQALRGRRVASSGRDGSREEWGGRWPRAEHSPRDPSVMSRAEGGTSSPSRNLCRRLPRALANLPPCAMPTPGLRSSQRSPCRLLGPR